MEPDDRTPLTPQQQALLQAAAKHGLYWDNDDRSAASPGQLTPQQHALLSPQQQAQLQLQVPGMQAMVVMMPSAQQQPGQIDLAQQQQQYGQQLQQQHQQQQQQELSMLMPPASFPVPRAEGQGAPCNKCHAECSHSMRIVTS